jgi:hypothetical protein
MMGDEMKTTGPAIQLRILLTSAMAMAWTLLLSGCPGDESADMARQISGGGGRQAPGGSSGGGTPAKTPGAETETLPAGGGEKVEPAKESEEAVEETTTMIEVEILNKEIKAPYPEYDKEGFYDVMVEVLAPKDPESGLSYGTRVWKIIMLDKAGVEVASMEKQIKVPDHKPGTLRFNAVYALGMPDTIQFHLSDKTAASSAATDTKDGKGGREGGEEGGSGLGRGRGGSGGGEGEGEGEGGGGEEESGGSEGGGEGNEEIEGGDGEV